MPSPTLAIANRKLLHPQLTDILDLMDDQSIPAMVVQRSLAALDGAVVRQTTYQDYHMCLVILIELRALISYQDYHNNKLEPSAGRGGARRLGGC